MIREITPLNRISNFYTLGFCGRKQKTNIETDTFVKRVDRLNMNNLNSGIESTVKFLRDWSNHFKADQKTLEAYQKSLSTLKEEDPKGYDELKDLEVVPYNTSFKVVDMKTSRDPIKIIKELIIRTPGDPADIKGSYKVYFNRNGEAIDDYLEVN